MPAVSSRTITTPLFLIVFCLCVSAHADTDQVEDQLVVAEDAFLDVEYEAALEALAEAEEFSGATDEQLMRLLALRGTLHHLLGNEADARTAYLRLLAMDPHYHLPEEHPPRAGEFLDSVRAERDVPISIDHRSPVRFEPTESFDIIADISGVRSGQTISIFYRSEGDSAYRSTEMERIEGDRFAGEIPASAQTLEDGGEVEYFILVAQGEERLAHEGSPRDPLTFIVGVGDDRSGSGGSVARSWWFWTIIGAAIAAGLGLGLGLGLGGDQETTGAVEGTAIFP